MPEPARALGSESERARLGFDRPAPEVYATPVVTNAHAALLVAKALAAVWRVVEGSPFLANLERNGEAMLGKSKFLIHPYVRLDRGFVFIHIPKAAGTSLGRALGLEATLTTPLHARARDIMPFLRLIAPGTIAVAFVRNPYARFFSLYNFARADESLYHSASDPAKAPYGKHPDHDLLADKSLEQCAELLVQGKLGDPKVWPTLWTPQVEWLVGRDRQVIVDFIGKVESMDADLRRLKRQHGIDSVPAPWLNKSGDAGQLPPLTPRTVELLRLFYKRDFELLGYEE